jgi:hypothetical protein
MTKRKIGKKSVRRQPVEKDSVYFLKILMYFIVGSIWIKLGQHQFLPGIHSIPVGLFIGLLFATHDHFAIDRKVEYAILLAAAFLSLVSPLGVVVQL